MATRMQRSSRKLNDCGLSTSLYSSCYPDSLTENAARAASNASMSGFSDYHHSEYGGGVMPSQEGVRFYIGEDHDDDDQADMGVDAAAALEAGGSDTLSLFEEFEHSQLQRVLVNQVGPEILGLFTANFGTSASVQGLVELMPSIIEDLLHLSAGEPYGVRGANLIVLLGKPLPRSSTVRKSSVMSANSSASVSSGYDEAQATSAAAEVTTVLGTTKLCAETVTTFNLILTMREGRTPLNSIKNWMAANVFKSKQCVVLEPQFTLRKKMLYR